MLHKYTISIQNCTFHASFVQVPMNFLYKAVFDVGITVNTFIFNYSLVEYFLVMSICISKPTSLVKVLITISVCNPHIKTASSVDFTWLNGFIYLYIFKWQISSSKFLTPRLFCMFPAPEGVESSSITLKPLMLRPPKLHKIMYSSCPISGNNLIDRRRHIVEFIGRIQVSLKVDIKGKILIINSKLSDKIRKLANASNL